MAYTDTIREQIIASICAELVDIRTASGYNVDLGSTVKRAQKLNDKDKLPAVAVFPLTEDNEPIQGKNLLTMNVRIEGLSKFGSKNPSVVAEAMLGDIIKRMTNPTLNAADDIAGGFAESVRYLEGGVDDYPDDGQYSVGVFGIFAVNYKTKIGDPYNQ